MQRSGGRGSGGEGRGSYVTAVPSEFSGVVWRSLKFSRLSLLPPPLEPLNQPGGLLLWRGSTTVSGRMAGKVCPEQKNGGFRVPERASSWPGLSQASTSHVQG